MSLGMTAEPSGNVDGDFVAMMTAHQQGAIDVAESSNTDTMKHFGA